MITEVSTETQFRNIINLHEFVLVDFFAEWCGPCKLIAPWMEELANENPTIGFVKVDVEVMDDLAAHYKIRAMPTFVLLKNGVEVGRFAGANVRSGLITKIYELNERAT